jgi:photosystem II stability/assembly factor-like uncharacterized protein
MWLRTAYDKGRRFGRTVLILITLVVCAPQMNFSQQWVRQASNVSVNLRAVYFTDSLTGCACGDSGVIIRTTNGGSDWLKMPSPVSGSLEDITFIDPLHGWMCGDSGTILTTTDAGVSWVTAPTLVRTRLTHVDFRTPREGSTSGENGLYLVSQDSGITWQIEFNPDSIIYCRISHWIDHGHGAYVVNQDSGTSQHFYTWNAGRVWGSLPNGELPIKVNNMTGWIAYRDGVPMVDYYCAVGEKGMALIWYVLEGNFDSPFRMAQTADSLDLSGVGVEQSNEGVTLWAVGEKGKIINTTDVGLSWNKVGSGETKDLNDISFTPQGHGWIVGDSGVILYRDNLVGVSENGITKKCHIQEVMWAYPNPFNPSTTIHFELPRESQVTLTLYNVLGEEVRTILNERRTAGIYDVRVDGSGLPSGVYYYRIAAGSFRQTRKMMVVR